MHLIRLMELWEDRILSLRHLLCNQRQVSKCLKLSSSACKTHVTENTNFRRALVSKWRSCSHYYLHQGDMDNHQNKGDDVGWTKNRYLLVQSLADRHPFPLCVYTDTFCSLHIISKYSYLMRPCLLLNKLCTLPVPNEKQVTFLWYSRAGVIWSLFHRLLGDLYSSSKMITKSDLKQIWV